MGTEHYGSTALWEIYTFDNNFTYYKMNYVLDIIYPAT